MKLQKYKNNQTYKRIFLIFGIVLLLLVIGITFYKTHAYYKEEKSYSVIKGTIPEFSTSDITLAYTINQERSKDAFPVKEDGYEVQSVTCDDEVEAEWDIENWSLKITGNKKHVSKIKCNIDFTVTLSNYLIAKSGYDESIVKEEHEETVQTEALTDYRFVGADPNNYVCLESDGICDDSELYRIIGVIPTQSSESGPYENRLKLVKYINYGRYSWTGSWNNKSTDWTISTLNTEILNGTYWTEIMDYHQYIDLAKWYIDTSNCVLPVNETYKSERSKTTNIITNVGLMYASDYGYATSGNEIKERSECLKRNLNQMYDDYLNCSQTNYLYNLTGTIWLQNKTSGANACVIEKEAFTSSGIHIGGINVWTATDMVQVYPSFYLKYQVKYAGGTGEKTNPYRIIINE